MGKAQGKEKDGPVERWVFFVDPEEKELGSSDTLPPIPLCKGMIMGLWGKRFEVVEWEYHDGQGDEKAGLKITIAPLH